LRLLFLLAFFILTGTVKGQSIFLESFDDETFPPMGWTQAQVFGVGLWERTAQGYNPICTPRSGEGMAFFDSYKTEVGTSAVLISPDVDLSGFSGLKLQIWLYRDGGSSTKNDALDLYINTISSLTGAHLLGTLYRPISANPVVSSPGWYCYDFDVPNDYNGDTNHILIKGTSQYGRNLFIDDVRLYKPVAGNGTPTNFAASNVSRSEMTIQWEDNSTNEDGFRVYISTDEISYTKYDDDITSTTREGTGEIYSKNISGLLPNTTYYFRIAAFVDIDSEYLEGEQATLPAGTVESEGSGDWSDPDTWSSGSVPAITDNIIIAEGHTVTLDVNGGFNQLTVNGNLALRGYELSGIEVTIGETGSLYVIEGTTANLIITGDLNNLGNLDFYASSSIYGRITFTGTNSQILDAVGTTNIGDMTVNKGASYNHMVEIIANGAFTIKSGSTDSFLTLSNGTIKISGSASVQTVMFPSGGYVVSPSSGIWLNNPNFTVLGHTTGTAIEGFFKLTSGTFTVGSSSIFAMTARKGATMIIEGGTLNLAGRFYSDEEFNFTLSGGTINTGLFYNGTTKASFGITSPSSNVTITGGVINIKSASTADTQEDYNVQSTNLNITGGTLRLGNAATSSPYTFRIQGNVPNLEIDNSVNPKIVLLSGTTKIYGDITVESGAVLNTRNHSIQIIGNPNQVGDIVNDGLITNTSASGSNYFTFAGLHGGQTLSGTGTFGDVTTPFAAISFANPAGVVISSSVVANRIDLITGMVTGADNITLGNGGVSTPVLQRGGLSSKVVGSVDQTPIFNPGTTCSVIYSLGLNPYSTGFELPEDLQGTLEMASNVDITLNRATSVNSIFLSASNAGNLITSQSKLLTVSGTDPEDVSIVTGNTGYVYGPLALTLPVSLESEAIYTFPIGKGSNNHFELIDPITNALGKTIIGVEVFDVATGGSAGNNIEDGSLGNRYWNAEIISGEDNFVETKVRVSQANPTLALDDGLARSATLTGEYDLVSIDQPVDNTITSDPLTELGYFTIAKKEISQVYQSSTTIHPNLDIAMRGDANELILRIEVVAVGNLPALEVSNFDFNTSGTTDLADIAKARLFFTGTSPVFSTVYQVGQTIVNPGSTFSITLSEELQEGTNYFWLTYDIADDATEGNVVDAGCIGITIGGIERTPSVTDPVGNRLVRAYMSGNYLVGVGGDYGTITEAIEDLMLVGVNSSVTLLLTDDNYSNDEVFPITVNSIKKSSPDNTVTIKPAADVTTEIIGNSADPLIIINASNFIIDGSNLPNGTTRDLTLVNEDTDTASGVIRVNEDADNIYIRSIMARSGVTTAGYGISMDGVSNAVISNCKIERANVGIQLSGGSSGIIIEENDLGSSISENKIHTIGIDISNTTDFTICNNTISGISSTSFVTASGIVISDTSTDGLIYSNTIKDIKNVATFGYGSNALWLSSTEISAQIHVFNNFISDIASAGNTTWAVKRNGYGIVIDNGGGYHIYYNTIYLNTDQTKVSGGNTAGINIFSTISPTASLDIRNNVIVSTQTKGTRYAVYSEAPKTAFSAIDYNNYHAPSGIGYFGGAVRSTLTEWKSATGKDSHSLNVPVYFTSATDLTPISNMNCALDGAGVPIASIYDDAFGEQRDAVNPDIGAVEFASGLASPEISDESICIGEDVPSLTATTVGTAKWYSDDQLQTLIHTGNILETGETGVGNYTYYVTDNHGTCISEAAQVSLSINPLPDIDLPDDFAVCFGEPVTLTATGDADMYQWDNDIENGVEFIPTETLTYTVIATISATGCQNTQQITVTVKPIPEPTISTMDNLIHCPGDVVSTTFTVDIIGDSYQWLRNGLEIPLATGDEYTATEAGDYSVIVTVDECSGESNEISVKVIENPIISTVDRLEYCEGEEINTTFTIDMMGDSYQWLDHAVEIEGAIDDTYTANSPGLFSVEMLVEGCVVTSNELEVVVYPIPTPIIDTDDALAYCEGDPVSVTMTVDIADGLYQWYVDNGAIEDANLQYYTATVAGTYYAEVTVSGCTGISNALEVVVNPIPIPVIDTDDALTYCEGDPISVTMTVDIADGLYQWYDAEGAIPGATLQNYEATTAGTYYADVTVNGCTGTSNAIEVVVNPIPIPLIDTDDALVYCEGDPVSVTMTIDIADGLYQWYDAEGAIPGATLQSYEANAAGTYYAEVTVNGCTGISNALEVVVNPIPTPIIDTDDALAYCDGEPVSVTMTVDIADGLYQWYDNEGAILGATLQNYTATAAGTYFAEVTVNGCTGTSNAIEVVLNPIPTPVIDTDDALAYCEGEPVSVTMTVDIADGQYQWYDAEGAMPGATLQSYEATAAGTYYAEVTVNGCTGISNALEVVVNPIPIPIIDTDDALAYCDGDPMSVTMTIDISDGLYQWYDAEGAIPGATLQSYEVTAAGIYFAAVTVNGCTGISNAIEVVVNPIPTPIIDTDDALIYCEGEPVSVTITVDIADGLYQWYDAEGAIPGATLQSYEANAAGIYFAEVTVNGCTGISNELEIIVFDLPQPILIIPDIPPYFCEGDDIQIEFSVDIQDAEYYQWFLNGNPIEGANDYHYTATAAGEYYVEVTVNGCTGTSDTYAVIVIESLSPVLTTDDQLTWCSNDEIIVNFVADVDNPSEYPVEYRWLLNGELIENASGSQYLATMEGLYSVEVSPAEYTCSWISNELQVIVNQSPVVSIATDTVFIKINEEYLFDAGEGYSSYLWFDESTEQTNLFRGEEWGLGTFDVWVEVSNEYGCIARDSAVVVVGPLGIDYHSLWSISVYPNPANGDFYIEIDGVQKSRQMQISIYNVMGQLVFVEKFNPLATVHRQRISLTDPVKGIYIVSVTDGNLKYNTKLIIE